MNIEIWSDFACPFCYIGKRRLEEALQQFPHRNEFNVTFRSYQLDPTAKRDNDQDLYDVLATKYGMSRQQAKASSDQVSEQARQVGLDFHLDTAVHTNTGDAHRLAQYAYDQGKGLEMTERLLKAYFTDSLHLGDHAVLVRLATEVGLEKEAVQGVLESNQYADKVEGDQQYAMNLGVSGVPFFVFEQKYAISGAQPTNVFKETLEKVWQEKGGLTFINPDTNGDDGCSDGSCNV